MKPRYWLLVTIVVAALYLGLYLTRGWYPHDEGALGQTAERVLHGQLPHRDFDEPYTGLLTLVHAAAFKIGGIRLPVLRAPLFIAALVGIAACFGIALRLVSAPAASGVALLALAWSVPNYPASMPSWYNLVCALCGALALLRWEETGQRRWIFLAGLAGGISFLVKLSGLFYVAGAGLFLLFATNRESDRPGGEDFAGSLVKWGLTLLLLGFCLLLWRVVAPFYWPRVIFHFVFPGVALALGLVVQEWKASLKNARARLGALTAVAAPFTAGVVLPVAVFGLVFFLAGGLQELIQGVFVVPFRRLAFANMVPPAPFWILAAVPLGLLIRPRADWAERKWRLRALLTAAVLAGLVWLASVESFPHRMIWQSLRSMIPFIALIAAVGIGFPAWVTWRDEPSRRRFVLLAIVASMASLIQFPFSSPIYFLYIAPLLLLALLALVRSLGRTPAPLGGVVLGFYAGFAVLLVTPGAVRGLGFRYERAHETVPLRLPRGGLRVNPEEAAVYEALIPKLQQKASGQAIWAGPDSPEVYFLGAFQNPTRAVFDFLGSADAMDLPQQLDQRGVRAIVINQRPSFSPALPTSVLGQLRASFPEGDTLGHFELRWR